jgi:hypothetical protein
MGGPLTEWKNPKVMEKVRAAVARGDSYRSIMKTYGVGNSVVARIYREAKDAEAKRQAAAREALIAKLMDTGMSRASAVNLLDKTS